MCVWGRGLGALRPGGPSRPLQPRLFHAVPERSRGCTASGVTSEGLKQVLPGRAFPGKRGCPRDSCQVLQGISGGLLSPRRKAPWCGHALFSGVPGQGALAGCLQDLGALSSLWPGLSWASREGP